MTLASIDASVNGMDIYVLILAILSLAIQIRISILSGRIDRLRADLDKVRQPEFIIGGQLVTAASWADLPQQLDLVDPIDTAQKFGDAT